MLEKNIRYKQVVRCQLYGDDDLYYNSVSSQYTLLPFTISSISFSGGSGYGTEAPILSFIGGSGDSLRATATVAVDTVSNITVTNRRKNYLSLPNIYQRHSTVGTIATITVNTGGTGYPISQSLPVVFKGGGGFEAYAVANTNASGVITTILVGNHGYNYSSAPTIEVIGTYTTQLTYTVNMGAGTLATLTLVGQVINSKKKRFDLEGALADIIFSRNARAIVEMACIPSIANWENRNHKVMHINTR